MRLWIVSEPTFFDDLQRGGVRFGNWSHVDAAFERAYRWMAQQMSTRCLDCGGNPPIWAWHSCGAPERRFDMRSSRLARPAVRLTLDVPDSLVLLSCFEHWHAVLNNEFLAGSEAEQRRWDDEVSTTPEAQSLKEQSWLRIFELGPWGDQDLLGSHQSLSVQACLPYLDHNWIRKTEHFR